MATWEVIDLFCLHPRISKTFSSSAEEKYLIHFLSKSIISKVTCNYTYGALSHPLGKRAAVTSSFLWWLQLLHDKILKLPKVDSGLLSPERQCDYFPVLGEMSAMLYKTTACTNSSNRCLVSCAGAFSWNPPLSPCWSFHELPQTCSSNLVI